MNIWFQDWIVPARLVLMATCTYAGLVILLRISGKRTLSKMNAFDLVVTIALGSILATALLSKDVSLAEGILAAGLLIALQWAVAWLSVRSPAWQNLIKSEPRLLVLRGSLQEAAMRAERITRTELEAALRSSGFDSLSEVTAVVLETDGSISVIPGEGHAEKGEALRNLQGDRA